MQGTSKHVECAVLGLILLLFAGVSVVGITWGLPGRGVDPYLFGDAPPWPGEKIYRLAQAEGKFSPTRGADVDADPLDRASDEPIPLTATEQDVARIYLRYRLYTHQPDEMITMMALAGMKPSRFDFDPRLYQYGGLFLYPIGAFLKTCGVTGLIDVRSDIVYYLDRPDMFGRFYVVARAYAAAWGLLGVYVVFLIARGLGGSRAGLLAALLFTLMPVTVCMAHEGKPHLPGAVLMLAAVLFAMRFVSSETLSAEGSTVGSQGMNPPPRHRDWWWMCLCCGGALGMVLSSLPIFVLIPILAVIEARRSQPTGDAPAPIEDASPPHHRWVGSAMIRTTAGVGLAALVYLLTNPYIVINAFVNREVLRSNFGNSLAMYDIARIGEGLIRVLELTCEGATLPLLILGLIALGSLVRRGLSGVRHRLLEQLFFSRTVRQDSGAASRTESPRGLKPAAQGLAEPAARDTGPGLARAAARGGGAAVPLAISALVFFVQFVLIGAGKPAEYGRFGIFPNTALAIGAACVLTHRWWNLRTATNWVAGSGIVLWVALCGGLYLSNFRIDTPTGVWQSCIAELMSTSQRDPVTNRSLDSIAVLAVPAPYCCPPIDFARTDVFLLPDLPRARAWLNEERFLVHPVDRPIWNRAAPSRPDGVPASEITGQVPLITRSDSRRWGPFETPISWANKPFQLQAGVMAPSPPTKGNGPSESSD